ncbi:DNA ligase 4 [Aulographum hederae CBS 113979]|uniref:DNA ligase n=1 Tax=Aulographum hederae CBS 113979 TaxID=1176131 RepID=A0A6G1H076_9PEZI|nr:DNA ligase 4 [Aulographum hederae CBS 113979]
MGTRAPKRNAEAEEEDVKMYGADAEADLNQKYPNRPHNHAKTLPFHDLYTTLFNPLNENKKKPTGPAAIAKRKQGRHGQANLSPNEIRRSIIESFISRWRKEVGNDIYPAFRLIVPEKDRDRAMYGLKEKTIAKLLTRVLRIDQNSEDGSHMLNWKLPGQKITAAAGDFAGRCFEVISKRPMRSAPGDMTIGQVNEMLDKLSTASKEEDQLPIFREFYQRMNADEMMWLIRMILRQMKVGATEKTFFDVWHPDAEDLFNVSSSLRRVCWELHDPSVRLAGDDRGITLMNCFQPQLAAFQMHDNAKIPAKMKPTETDNVFWVEEKLDGERMQLHMIEDDNHPGGKRFGFWSRKAKDYTYLYGNGFEDDNSSLTRHLKNAFDEDVRNIILDGEMITWDMEQDAVVPFGTLKTAALSEQKNPFGTGQRPFFRVFDCLYMNDMVLTNWTLRDRRNVLTRSVNPVHRRLEVHEYTEATTPAEIDTLLTKVIAEGSEGLVVKNPRSMYRLNERNDDWIKSKPEYMTGYGEDLDCVVIGGYYGSGHRGGFLSSFICGLRVDQHQINQGMNPQHCFSFFKVGGGMSAAEYSQIQHRTDGKWKKWDPKKPPTEFISLGGGDRQFERPDEWIKPEDSIVISAKASQVTGTDQFKMGMTLRFPRFKKIRTDKDWKSALSIQGFIDLKNNAEQQEHEKEFKIDDGRRKRARTTRQKPLQIAGQSDDVKTPYAGPDTKVFEGLTFYIMTEFLAPTKKSKGELEQMVKANGGTIVQRYDHISKPNTICIADRRLVPVSSLQKKAIKSLVRPAWLFDCIKQSEVDVGRPPFLLPLEPGHMFYTIDEEEDIVAANVDEYGDSYARDVDPAQLKALFADMRKTESIFARGALMEQFIEAGMGFEELPGSMFRNCVVCFEGGVEVKQEDSHSDSDHDHTTLKSQDLEMKMASLVIDFAAGRATEDIGDPGVTHVVLRKDYEPHELKKVRERISRKRPTPRIVTHDWVNESWSEKTLLDEDRFAPS